MKIATALVFAIFIRPALAESLYDCSTEFGESVPIRLITLKKGQSCLGCEQPGATVPEDKVEKSLSHKWNESIERMPHLKSKTKRRVFSHDDHLIFLDTRYAVTEGKSFQFYLKCPLATDSQSKCIGEIKDHASGKPFILQTGLLDQRTSGNSGRAELTIGNREHLGWIVRLIKNAVPLDPGKTIPVSGSGELKFWQEDEHYLLDVGVDEQLQLIGDFRTRLAAIELKIRCHRLKI